MACKSDTLCHCTTSEYLGDGSYDSGFRGIPPWQTQYEKMGSIHWPKGAKFTKEPDPCTPEQPGSSDKQDIRKLSDAINKPLNLLKGVVITPAPDPSVVELPEPMPALPAERAPYIM